jgi:hypothetical protein
VDVSASEFIGNTAKYIGNNIYNYNNYGDITCNDGTNTFENPGGNYPADHCVAAPSSSPSISAAPSLSPSAAPSLSPSISAVPSLSPFAAPSLSPSISVAPSSSPSLSAAPSISAAPTRPLWVNPDDSAFSPLSTDDYTDVETITLGDEDTAIVDIGFAYNWFGNDLTQLELSSNGFLAVGDYYSGSYIIFSRTLSALDPSAGGAVKVGRKESGADESFKVSFENIQGRNTGLVNVQVELFPNGDIIFCYGSGEVPYNSLMIAGVENSDLGKAFPAFPIPGDTFDSNGRTFEWPTDSCWKFQMP